MRSTSTELRCKHCDALLAKQDRDGLALRRGDFQIAVTGTDFTASITCYRCRTLNVAAGPGKRASAAPSSKPPA
jgi:phage FluMu protein Com